MKCAFLPKLLLFLLIVCITVRCVAQPASDLFISEYVEGSANNKALEIYNGTGTTIDLAAGGYTIQMYFNGSTSAGTTVSLTGSIAPGAVFVLAQASASFAGAAYVNQTNAASWFNGDDVVVLRKGGASGPLVDVIGQLGVDPGTEWGTGLQSTADNTLRRKAGNCLGDINANDFFDPASNFDGFAQDDFSGLGSHITTCQAGPSIVLSVGALNFSTTAGQPSSAQTYTVQGNSLQQDIVISVPAMSSFGISLSSGGPYTSMLTIPFSLANSSSIPVYIVFNSANPGTQTGNLTHTSGTITANIVLQGTALGADGITRIFSIQGTGSSSSFDGAIVTTEGIVTADFQGAAQLGGFFIQDTAGDGNPNTSDGIFVFNSSFPVRVGDYVRLTGEVDEFFNKTEIKNLASLTVMAESLPTPSPVIVQLPVAATNEFEKYEGMLVKFSQQLTVTETFSLGRFGELSLSANGRLFNPTSIVDLNDDPASGTNSSGTSNIAAVQNLQNQNNRSRILLDDGSTVENPALVPYLNPIDTTLRIGSTISNLTGIMDYDFGNYRIQPSQSPSINYAPRPGVPSVGNAHVRIASFNVLNYFNGDGLGAGFPTARGANTLSEFTRQRTKISNALFTLNADVIGLIEIENDGDGPNSAVADLVNALNATAGAGTYAYINDPAGANGNPGTDAIKQAIIYKPSVVTPLGLAIADMNPVYSRPPIAQLFSLNSSGEKFTVIINHFKSKSCTGATGLNTDQLDGQGCFNQSRKQQALALLSFVSSLQASSGDSDIVSLGDYNAYAEEDPIDILRAGGLTETATGFHSYVFQGQTGSLDYAFVSSSLLNKISGSAKWNINSDEPIVKDYNQEFNPPYVFSNDAFRSSDHDPVLLGLNLSSPVQNIKPVVTIVQPLNGTVYDPVNSITVLANATDADGSIVKVEFFEGTNRFAVDSTAPYSFSGSNIPLGNYTITARAFDNNGDSTISDTVRISVANCTANGFLMAFGYTDIPGSRLINLSSHPSYPGSPSVITQVNKFEYGPNLGDNYGARLKGLICVPLTGNYIFYLASNDQSELWLSTDSDPQHQRRIAFVENSTGFRSWFVNNAQRSVPVFLRQGLKYYVETVHKEGEGADHLSVAWLMPNGVFEGPIPGTRLSSAITQMPLIAGVPRSESNFETALKKISGEVLFVTVAPNPSSAAFSISIRSTSTGPIEIKLVNTLGQVMYQSSRALPVSQLVVGENLTAGIYFAEIRQGVHFKRLKLIRQ
jgi:predicted extracellular nuclease